MNVCVCVSVGGVGVTLTAADQVIILDPSWTPAHDFQAVDRAHRMGQTVNTLIHTHTHTLSLSVQIDLCVMILSVCER